MLDKSLKKLGMVKSHKVLKINFDFLKSSTPETDSDFDRASDELTFNN